MNIGFHIVFSTQKNTTTPQLRMSPLNYVQPELAALDLDAMPAQLKGC
jgi:hypothetical protein